MPAGTTSRRSTMAEAPETSTISAPASRAAAIAWAISSARCPQRVSPESGQSSAARRPSTAAGSCPAGSPSGPAGGSEPGDPARPEGGDPRIGGRRGDAEARRAAHRHGEGDDLDGGGHLARLHGRVGRQGGDGHRLVHTVEPVEAAAVEDRRPRASAIRLQRPVKAALAVRPGPRRASAMASAASSSCTSPGSSRAATTLSRPAAARAATSSARSRRPFLKASRRA